MKDIPEDKAEAPKEPSRLASRNLVTCESSAQCDQYWVLAVAYAKANATTAIQTLGTNILITAPRRRATT